MDVRMVATTVAARVAVRAVRLAVWWVSRMVVVMAAWMVVLLAAAMVLSTVVPWAARRVSLKVLDWAEPTVGMWDCSQAAWKAALSVVSLGVPLESQMVYCSGVSKAGPLADKSAA